MSKLICILFCFALPVVTIAQHVSKPIPVIFDTDMGPDYDDVGAIALLHAFADSGKIRILGTMASTGYDGVSAVLSAFNTYFGRPRLPVGVPKGEAVMLRDEQHWSDTIQAKYPHRINRNDETQGTIDVYRRLLAAEEDTSVVIITVGFLTNIADLLQSPADHYSSLTGQELVKRKVKKLVSMAGMFPSGKEFNVEKDAASAKYAFENFPRPVVLSGFEIGQQVRTGLPLIANDSIQNSPVKDVFRICINMREEDKNGRQSWDQTAVLVAVNGHEPYYTLEYGNLTVDADGTNHWNNKGKKHARLIEKASPAVVQDLINRMMMHQPLASSGK